MSKLTSSERKHLESSEFAEPGKRKYPVDTKNRARNALARVSQFGNASEKKQVSAAVHRKFPAIGEKSKKKARGKIIAGKG